MGLYSTGMHSYVMRELELGRRAAACEDSEMCGLGEWVDVSFKAYLARSS